jgi:hypothetical protein
MKSGQNLVKLTFNLSPDWHGSSTESVWAEPTPNGTLIIRNTPFYAKGVSFLDEVSFADEDGAAVFEDVVQKSGHSTYRILQPNKNKIERFEEFWKPIERLGCSLESKIDKNALYAVDVPPNVDVRSIYSLLEEGEKADVWDFEEADYCNNDE